MACARSFSQELQKSYFFRVSDHVSQLLSSSPKDFGKKRLIVATLLILLRMCSIFDSAVVGSFTGFVCLILGGDVTTLMWPKSLPTYATDAFWGKNHSEKNIFAGAPLTSLPHSRYFLATC